MSRLSRFLFLICIPAILYSTYDKNRAFQKEPYFYSHINITVTDTSRKEMYPHVQDSDNRQLLLHIFMPTPIKDSPCSLVIISHGLGGVYNGMTYEWLCKRLVIDGCIVICISHPYACKPLVLNGIQIDYLFACVPHLAPDYFSGEMLTWIADIRYVIDVCEKHNNKPDSIWYKRFEESKIVIAGHSFGGAAAINSALCDDRVYAAINMDGLLYCADSLNAIEKPTLCIIGQLYDEQQNAHVDFAHNVLFNAQIYSLYMKEELKKITMKALRPSMAIVVVYDIVHEMFADNAYILDDSLMCFVRDPLVVHNQLHSYIQHFLYCCWDGKKITFPQQLVDEPRVVVHQA